MSEIENIRLELGDIIRIQSPANSALHEKVFYISYVDLNSHTTWINIENNDLFTVRMSKGRFDSSASIEQIQLLSRSTEKGFAKQNKLLLGTWIDIHFGGDTPFIITGLITDLEEDMIEVTNYVPEQSGDKMYIDFAYKGIPEQLPIKNICIRDKPLALQEPEEDAPEEDDEDETQGTLQFNDDGTLDIFVPENVDVQQPFRQKLLDEQKESPESYVTETDDSASFRVLPKKFQKYQIEAQLNDLYNEMLAEVPEEKRTNRLLVNLETNIKRFQELRDCFSKKDGLNRIIGKKDPINPITHKPMGEALVHYNARVPWVIPVVTQRNKLYDIDGAKNHQNNDTRYLDTGDELTSEKNMENILFYKNNNRNSEFILYQEMRTNMYNVYTPFEHYENPNYYSIDLTPSIDVDAIVANYSTNESDFVGTFTSIYDPDAKVFATRGIDFACQRYNSETFYYPQVQKKTFEKRTILPGDNMHVHSYLFMPTEYMNYGKYFLPGSSIYDKANNLFDRHLYGSLILKANQLTTYEKPTQLDVENDNDNNIDKPNKIPGVLPKEKQVQHVILYDRENEQPFDELETREEKEYVKQQGIEQLKANLPTIFDAIDHVVSQRHNMYNVPDFVKQLEPFMFYMNDFTAGSYKKMRYFLLQNQKRYLQHNLENKKQFQALYNQEFKTNVVILNNALTRATHKNVIEELFATEPQVKIKMDTSYKLTDFMSSSMLHHIYKIDDGKLFSNLIKYMATELTNEDDFFKDMEEQNASMLADEDEEEREKAFSKDIDCNKKTLTKIYHSLEELREDNNREITYDSSLDYTNYKIINNYKEEQKKRSKEDFLQYLESQLVRKHNCPSRLAKTTAEALVRGTRYVEDGEYAKLIIYPELPDKQDETTLTEKEKQEINIEKNVRKKESYYVRKRDNWVYDETINEQAFVDTSVIFCNLQQTCYQKDDKNACENIELDTRQRMLLQAKKEMSEELLSRYDKHVGENRDKIDEQITRLHDQMIRNVYILFLREMAANNFSVNLGKKVERNEKVISPYWRLRDKLFHHSINFTERQRLIVDFYRTYCREPLADEEQGWKYCFESNTKLLEKSLYALALAYEDGTYMTTLDMICKKQGVLSDDGDKVMDKESGCELRKIEYSEAGTFLFALDDEQDTDESHDDSNNMIVQKIKKVKTINNKLMYDDKKLQDLYDLLITVCTRTFVPIDSVETFVMNLCDQLIQDKSVVKTKTKYEKDAAKNENKKDTNKKAKILSYDDYFENKKVEVLGCALLVAVQTMLPSFQTKKYERSCAYSFEGYPLDNSHRKGITYVACVLRLLMKPKKVIPQKEGVLEERIYSMLEKSVMSKEHIQHLYKEKRAFIEEQKITNQVSELDVSIRWGRFLPPLVELDVLSKGLHFVPSDFHDDLLSTIKKGHQDQWKMGSTYSGKLQLFMAGLIELIQNILQQKETLLNTASNVPYQQNACCNEEMQLNPLQYFSTEDPRVGVYIKTMFTASRLIKEMKTNYQTTFLHEKRTLTQVDDEIKAKPFHIFSSLDKDVMYKTLIHYCKYDYDNQVLPNDLKTICRERPDTYDPHASLEEKIELMNETNNSVNKTMFSQMMSAVHRRGLISPAVHLDVNWNGQCTAELEQIFNNVQRNNVFDKSNVINAFYDVLNEENISETMKNKLNDALDETNNMWKPQVVQFITRYYKKESNVRIQPFVNNFFDTFFKDNLHMTPDRISYNTLSYIKHITVLFPIYIATDNANEYYKGNVVSKHWNLLPEDHIDFEKYYTEKYNLINTIKGETHNVLLSTLLHAVLNDLNPLLHLFSCVIQMFPHHLEVNRKLIIRCYEFFTLLVFKTFIAYIDDQDILMQTNQKMSALRKKQRDQYEEEAFEDEDDDEIVEMTEVILSESKMVLQEGLGELLYAYVQYGINRTQRIHFESYENIMKIVERGREIEKNRVKKYYASLQNQSNDLLRAELVMKRMNLGKYFINQKDLITYGKKIENFYEDDHLDNQERMVNELMENDGEEVFDPEQVQINEQIITTQLDEDDIEDELLMEYEPPEEDDDLMDVYQYGN